MLWKERNESRVSGIGVLGRGEHVRVLNRVVQVRSLV